MSGTSITDEHSLYDDNGKACSVLYMSVLRGVRTLGTRSGHELDSFLGTGPFRQSTALRIQSRARSALASGPGPYLIQEQQ